jgi:hypothetical protein
MKDCASCDTKVEEEFGNKKPQIPENDKIN